MATRFDSYVLIAFGADLTELERGAHAAVKFWLDEMANSNCDSFKIVKISPNGKYTVKNRFGASDAYHIVLVRLEYDLRPLAGR